MNSLLVFNLGSTYVLSHVRKRCKSGPEYLGKAPKVLALLVLAFIAYEFFSLPPNLYRELSVPRNSSKSELRRHFKDASLRMHPDKNPNNPNAEENFRRMKEGFDLLTDSESASIYDRFGAAVALDQNRAAFFTAFNLFLHHTMHYAVIALVSYFATIDKSRAGGWPTSLGLIMASLLCELCMKHMGWDPLASILPYTTIFEKVELTRSLSMALSSTAVIWAQIVFVDKALEERALILEVIDLQRKTLDLLASEPWRHDSGVKVVIKDEDRRPRAWKEMESIANRAREQAAVQTQEKGGIPWSLIIFVVGVGLQFFSSK